MNAPIAIEQSKRYDITCPECGNEMLCCASHYQMTGNYAMGHGDCPNCGTAMQITYQPETGTMVAKDYVIYIDDSTNKH